MQNKTFTPALVTPAMVQSALKYLRQARSLSDHPLRQLVWIRHRFQKYAQVSIIDVDIAIAEALTNLIVDELTYLRQVENLITENAVERVNAVEQLKNDFHTNNDDLKAWSLLYYRYIRVDLALQLQQLSEILYSDPRQLRRHLQYGYRRLTELITHHEVKARTTNRQLWLKLKLPGIPQKALYGRDESLQELQQYLNLSNHRDPVLLVGAGGVGKTVLACKAVNNLIDEGRFHDVNWITLQELTTYSMLLSDLAKSMGYPYLIDFPPDELEKNLRVHLNNNQPCLVVIDNADELAPFTQIVEHLSRIVSFGKLLLIARRQPDTSILMARLVLGPLGFSAMKLLLKDEARNRRLAPAGLLSKDMINIIYEAIGGNPLAGQYVIGQLQLLPSERILSNLNRLKLEDGKSLFEDLFISSWDALSKDAQQAAVAISTLMNDKFSWQELYNAVRFSRNALDHALSELVRASFLDAHHSETTYFMQRLTRRFVEVQAAEASWQPFIWQLMNNNLLDKDNESFIPPRHFTICQQQIKKETDQAVLIELVKQNAPLARKTGQWLIWQKILEFIVDRLEAEGYRGEDLIMIRLELGVAYRLSGSIDKAQNVLEQVVTDSGERGVFVLQAQALLEFGKLYEFMGLTEKAYGAYQRAASVGKRYQVNDVRRQALLGLSSLALHNERFAEAMVLLEQAGTTYENEALDGHILDMFGRAHSATGKVKQAVEYFEKAQQHYQRVGDLTHQAQLHVRLGKAYHQDGQLEYAVQHLKSGFHIMHGIGDALGMARALTNLGVVQMESGLNESALSVWKEALELQKQLQDEVGMAYTQYNLADLYWKLDQQEIATKGFSSALHIAERLQLLSLIEHIKEHPNQK